MWESPINISQHIAEEVWEEVDNGLLKEIKCVVGYEVDQNELVKALAYDRGQYEKGYKDGQKDAVKHGRWEETTTEDPCYYRCSECGRQTDDEYNYCPNCGAKMDEVSE